MNTATTLRLPSLTALLGESLAALIAQLAVVLVGFLDLYFMARLGVESLATVSYVAGFVILVNAACYGALQAFLIVGGACLGRGDRPGFAASARAALCVALCLCGAAYLLALGVIGGLALVSPAVPPGAGQLALMLLPSMLINALCLVYRLKAMLLKASVLLILLSLLLLGTKFAALNLLFHGLTLSPGVALAGASLAAALLCLLMTWLADYCCFRPLNRERAERQALVARIKSLLALGVPIGAVIVLEMSVLGAGQMLQTLISPHFGAAYGLVIQLVLMAETVAVALGQVATLNVAMARAMCQRRALKRAVAMGLTLTLLLHGLIAGLLLACPDYFVALILPPQQQGDALLVGTVQRYLGYGAVCQWLLALVVCLAALLRGMDDLKCPLGAIAINYLGLGVLCSVGLAYLTELRDLGVWIGIAASLLSSVLVLSLRLMHNLNRSELLTCQRA